MKVNVGIDLGTTYSAVSYFDKETGKVVVLKNSVGKFFTPSVICIENGEVLIGEDAKNEQSNGNVNTAAFYKTMMGDDNYSLYIDGEEYTAKDLSREYLKVLKRDIEETNNIEIQGAVITVPAYFNEDQRTATLLAGREAGLKVLKIINEPTSAIIAYGLTGSKKKKVLVYDLGGGTFDVTIAEVNGSDVDILVTNGNHQLGGKDWDTILLNEVCDKFNCDYGIDLEDYSEEYRELLVKCEEAKKRLTSLSSTNITIQCEGYVGKYEVTNEMFEDRTSSLLNETLSLINQCFVEIGDGFGWHSIDEVVLVGGSTRMPQVKKMIQAEYGKAPITKDINVDTIVSEGAAMQAELCVSKVITLTVHHKNSENKVVPTKVTISSANIKDITSHSLGMIALNNKEEFKNSIIIKKNSKVNQEFSRKYTFKGEKLDVYVLQGESDDPCECDLLGKYIITGMTKFDQNNIDVTFLYNSNGIVEVKACITNGSQLSVTKEKVNESIYDLIVRLKEERKKKQIKPAELMVLIDSSGSMYKKTNGVTAIDHAKDAAIDFVNQLDLKNFYVSIVEFADRSQYNCKKSQDRREIINAINKVNPGNNVGVCNNECPITTHYNDFSSDNTKIMIVLTDGIWIDQNAEINSATKAKKSGTTIYAIGFGDADKAFLDKIASEKGGKKIDITKLKNTFQEIASSIATEVQSGNTLR